jgi:hypothetical protein
VTAPNISYRAGAKKPKGLIDGAAGPIRCRGGIKLKTLARLSAISFDRGESGGRSIGKRLTFAVSIVRGREVMN